MLNAEPGYVPFICCVEEHFSFWIKNLILELTFWFCKGIIVLLAVYLKSVRLFTYTEKVLHLYGL